MFKRVLIANRGEIALRISRALRELGIEVCIVHGREDRLSLPVRFSDYAIPLYRSNPLDSYLDYEAVIQAAKDVGAEALLRLCHGHSCEMIITLIGGQGHVFGRGNQQLSAPLIRQIGLQNIHILATKTKLKALHNRPLLVDTGDPVLDAELQGVVPVTCGYNDQVLYPIGNPHGR